MKQSPTWAPAGADLNTSDISPAQELPARRDALTELRADEIVKLHPAERLAELRRAIDGTIVFTHGFGIEGQLIFHWICEADIDVDVVTLDTGRLFPETYALWAETERRYGRRIRAIYPQNKALEKLVAKQGIDGFYDSKTARMACCDVRKVKPLDRALAGAAAWITGVRGDQNEVRHDAGLIGHDASRGLMKFNPLFDWTRASVMTEVEAHRVPINSLHAKGFCLDRLRALHARDSARRTRAQRALVVARATATPSAACICPGAPAARLERDPFRVESPCVPNILFEHDLFRKPVPPFRDHALGGTLQSAARYRTCRDPRPTRQVLYGFDLY